MNPTKNKIARWGAAGVSASALALALLLPGTSLATSVTCNPGSLGSQASCSALSQRQSQTNNQTTGAATNTNSQTTGGDRTQSGNSVTPNNSISNRANGNRTTA